MKEFSELLKNIGLFSNVRYEPQFMTSNNRYITKINFNYNELEFTIYSDKPWVVKLISVFKSFTFGKGEATDGERLQALVTYLTKREEAIRHYQTTREQKINLTRNLSQQKKDLNDYQK